MYGEFQHTMIWLEDSLMPQDLNGMVNIPGVRLIQ
jgi:hypothetical protein